MSKFKVGDRVRAVDAQHGWGMVKRGDVGVVTQLAGRDKYNVDFPSQSDWYASGHDLELVTSKGVKMSEPVKHLYRLKKDTLEHKAGTVFIEQCTDGTQDFDEFDPVMERSRTTGLRRDLVVDNSDWFEEVKIEYVPLVKRGRKPNSKKVSKTVTADSPYKAMWTPERRAAQAKRMKRIRKQRGANWGTK